MSLNNHPWISGDLLITSQSLSEMHSHALAEYPNECCGYASGPETSPGLIDNTTPMQNLAVNRQVSASLPAGRSSETYFVMDPLKLDTALRSGEASGRPVKVIYHSHPNNKGAYFSEEDREMFGEGSELTLPVAFIVLGVGLESSEPNATPYIIETKLWVFNALTKKFTESKLTDTATER